LVKLCVMGLKEDLEGGEKWVLTAPLVRMLWQFAKEAEWSGWNTKWRAHCCPFCGGPKSYLTHAEYCALLIAMRVLETQYPQVTRPLPMDPITEMEAKYLERLLLGGIERMVKGEEPRDPRKPFWED